jgi:hypothetical protein
MNGKAAAHIGAGQIAIRVRGLERKIQVGFQIGSGRKGKGAIVFIFMEVL